METVLQTNFVPHSDREEMDDLNTKNLVDKNTNLSTLISRLVPEKETNIETLQSEKNMTMETLQSEKGTNIEILQNEIISTPITEVDCQMKIFQNSKSKRTSKVVCRLCLNESQTASLDTTMEDMIRCILPEMKLSVSKSPRFCCECIATLKSSYSFKISCQKVETTVINLYQNSGENKTVDLRNCQNAMDEETVCRICLNVLKEDDCVKLYSSEDDPLKNMVERCLPDTDTNLTKEPMMCPQCLENLEEQFNFLMQCLDTEEKISFYCEEKGKQSDLDLYRVYLFSQCMDEEERSDASETENEEDHSLEEDRLTSLEISSKTEYSGKSLESRPITSTVQPSMYLKHEIPENQENFINLSEITEPNITEIEENNSELDPLADPLEFETNLVIKREKVYDAETVPTTETIKGYQRNEVEEDDCFEEETPSKRPRLQMETDIPYPINIIEAIPLTLDNVPFEDLSNIPVIDAQMNSFSSLFVAENTPAVENVGPILLSDDDMPNQDLAVSSENDDMPNENDSSPNLMLCNKDIVNKDVENNKDILAQLVDEINVSNQAHATDYEEEQILEAGCTYQYENSPQNKVKSKSNFSTYKNWDCKVRNVDSVDKYLVQQSIVDEILQETQENQTVESETTSSLENLQEPNDDSNQQKKVAPKKKWDPVIKPILKWLKCNKCNFKTLSPTQIEMHQKVHTLNEVDLSKDKDTLFKCDQCAFETKFVENFTLHKTLHLMKKPRKILYCDQCDFETIGINRLREHHKNSHSIKKSENVFFCNQCDFETVELNKLKEHKKELHSTTQKLFSCNKCRFETTKLSLYKNHKKVQHPQEILKHQCDFCEYETTFAECLHLHQQVHKLTKDRKTFVCDQCDFKTDVLFRLKNHKKDEHKPKYNCNMCEFSTFTKGKYGNHMKTHKNKKYTCEVCEFSTSSKQSFNLHKRTHESGGIKLRISLRNVDKYRVSYEEEHEEEIIVV